MIVERDMLPGDRRFVVANWVESFANYAPWSSRLVRKNHWAVVDGILDNKCTRVAVLGGENGSVHAWACGIGEQLHYAYVPPELRGHGLARRAITAVLGGYSDAISVSHPVPGGAGGWPRRRFHWNPYSLLNMQPAEAT